MVDLLHVNLMGCRRGLARRVSQLAVSVVFLLIDATDVHLSRKILSRYCYFVILYDVAAEEADD